MVEQTFLWEPAKYGEFADHRSRPFFDLTARIGAVEPRTVVDLGCGPGTLTATLARRWPQARVLGLDNSTAMLEQARKHTSAQTAGSLSFAQGDIATWMPHADTDVVVSNAALQWVPGHRSLMSQWLRLLHPGGWLAVQVPANFQAPSHVLMRELAASARWREQLAGVLRHEDAVAEPSDYQELFLQRGIQAEVWETTYHHVLQGPDPVLEWVRGTGLRPVLAALDAHGRQLFEQQYGALLAEAYPAGERGTIFPFRRIFMVGQKAA